MATETKGKPTATSTTKTSRLLELSRKSGQKRKWKFEAEAEGMKWTHTFDQAPRRLTKSELDELTQSGCKRSAKGGMEDDIFDVSGSDVLGPAAAAESLAILRGE